MTRIVSMGRWFTAMMMALSVGLGLVFADPSQAAEPPPAKPNVLFIAVDDLNDWIGALNGYPGVKTPNLDRLAKRGQVFTRAYCAAPACNPSRVALLCGLRPSTTGVYLNSQPWRPVLPKTVTLPQHFMAHDYHVVGGGKIYHGGFPDPASWHNYFKQQADPLPSQRPVNGIPDTAHFDWGPLDVSDEDMNDYKVAQWAANYLKKKQQDKPFFLAVGLYRPHLPWYVPKKYFDMYPLDQVKLPKVLENDLDDIPPIGRRMARPEGDHKKVVESNNWEKAVQGYLASITFSDVCLGMVLDALDNSPHADNTIIVLWGDHGWHLGQKQHWRKFALWEEATRVPLMMVVPGMTKPGARCERTVNLLDIYPTLIELCGLSAKPELEGTSIVPLLNDPKATWDRPSVCTHGRNNHAVRSERWRYIRYSDGTEELYDHDNDPLEWHNLAAKPEYASVKKQLAAALPQQNVPDAPSQNPKK
ncbi:MAG: sulfatase [Gemmataceae bacterium]